MTGEGIIKFDCRWVEHPLGHSISIRSVNFWRERLRRAGLIGLYPNGKGYGNLSFRLGRSKKFVITGSQTEGIARLGRNHYTVVTDFSIPKNRLWCEGPMKASSESLTHAMIYEMVPSVQSVMHVHQPIFWKKLRNKIPTTSAKVTYGTSAMAKEVEKLFWKMNLPTPGIFVMGGHKDGLVTFGADFSSAFHLLMKVTHSFIA